MHEGKSDAGNSSSATGHLMMMQIGNQWCEVGDDKLGVVHISRNIRMQACIMHEQNVGSCSPLDDSTIEACRDRILHPDAKAGQQDE